MCPLSQLGRLAMRHPWATRGTRQMRDGCHDPCELQNVFIFALQHARDIHFVFTRMLWLMMNSM